MPSELSLREIQTEYNRLVPVARERGINVTEWVRTPPTRERGIDRLNWLRSQLGMHVDREIEADAGARFERLPLTQIREEWNRLVPEAQGRGINVHAWVGLPPTSRRGMQRLMWLREQLGQQISEIAVAAVTGDFGRFVNMTFGVEIECMMPEGTSHYDVSRWMGEAGIDCRAEVYNHTTRGHWKIVTDGSLGNYRRGIEIVSPALKADAESMTQLRKVCSVLETKRFKVNKRCGLHIHIGAQNEPLATFKNLLNLYRAAERTIDSFMAPSRRGSQNIFCNPVSFSQAALAGAGTLDDVMRASNQAPFNPRGSDRYRKLNLLSMRQHGTIEFRQHQGTIEADKAVNWTVFCLSMVVASRTSGTISQINSIDHLLSLLRLDTETTDYFKGRKAHFETVDNRARARAARAEQQRNQPFTLSTP